MDYELILITRSLKFPNFSATAVKYINYKYSLNIEHRYNKKHIRFARAILDH